MKIDVDDKVKLQFLNSLLETDDNLLLRFYKYIDNLDLAKVDDIDEFTEDIYYILNLTDVEDYIDSCSYYEYYEENIGYEIAQDLLQRYVELTNTFKEENNIYKIFWIILAIYLAIKKEPELEDNLGLVYSYEESLLDYLYSDIILDNLDSLPRLKDSERIEILELYVSKLNDSSDYGYFNGLFIDIIDSKEIANYLKRYFNKFSIGVKLHILEILKEDEEYIKVAQKANKEDSEVAKFLLEKLYILQRYSEFEAIAKEVFTTKPSYFDDYLLGKVKGEMFPKLYKDLVKYKAINSDFNRYVEFKKLADSEEVDEVISVIKNSYYNHEYCIKILSFEKRYKELLDYVQSNLYIDFSLYSKILVEVYPDEILKMVLDKCNQEMSSYNRNRSSYKSVVFMLSSVYNSSIKDELKRYIQKIYNHKPRLPALKDELKKAKLV